LSVCRIDDRHRVDSGITIPGIREFQIATALVGYGAQIHIKSHCSDIYDTNSLERLRLTGFVLSQKLVVLPEFRYGLYDLKSGRVEEALAAQTGDTEGLVNYGLSIKGDKVMAVLMYDRKEEIKLSFRSLGNFSVNELARAHFEGGGHRNASGGSIQIITLEETLKKFLAILPEYKSQLLKE
jgi:phosphoesterase RecJ-like protein